MLKRWVLRLCLKPLKLGACRSLSDIEFHAAGPAWRKPVLQTSHSGSPCFSVPPLDSVFSDTVPNKLVNRKLNYIDKCDICCSFVRLLQPLLQHVYRGMSDDNVDVRNAAMFALGQFAIHLQVQNDLSSFWVIRFFSYVNNCCYCGWSFTSVCLSVSLYVCLCVCLLLYLFPGPTKSCDFCLNRLDLFPVQT